MLSVKTKEEYIKTKTHLKHNYPEYKKTNKGYLKNFRVQTELLPNAREY